jgi:hypothetical protein
VLLLKVDAVIVVGQNRLSAPPLRAELSENVALEILSDDDGLDAQMEKYEIRL